MQKIIKHLDEHLEEYLLAFLLVILTSVMFLQIIMRYIFRHPFSWPEELCRYCFVYFTFLTFSYCVKNDSMLRLDIIRELLPKKLWSVLQLFVQVVSLVFFVIMFINSLSLIASIQKTARVSPALGIPYTYIYLSTVISFALAVARCVQILLRPVYARFLSGKGEPD